MSNHPNRGRERPAQDDADRLLLADQMREWRDARNLTAKQAGEVLDISSRTVENIEGGRGYGPHRLLRIAIGVIKRP